MTHYVDARFDDTDRMFLPPLRTIGFNPQLTLNDSLLAQSYVEAYDISYPEALKRIEDEVAELRQRLENEGSYELPDVGVLSLNADHHYVFEPCEAGLLTPSLYGLDGFQMDPLEAAPAAGAGEEGVPVEAAAPRRATTLAMDAGTAREGSGKDRRTITLSLAAVRDVAAACIAVMCFFLFTSPLGNDPRTELRQSGINTEFLTRVMPRNVSLRAATKADAKERAPQAPAAKAGAKAGAPREEAAATTAPGTYYCIVLASHVARDNAEEYVARLARAGLDGARVLTPANASRKVVYGRYASEREALDALNRMGGDKHFAGSWVLHVK